MELVCGLLNLVLWSQDVECGVWNGVMEGGRSLWIAVFSAVELECGVWSGLRCGWLNLVLWS